MGFFDRLKNRNNAKKLVDPIQPSYRDQLPLPEKEAEMFKDEIVSFVMEASRVVRNRDNAAEALGKLADLRETISNLRFDFSIAAGESIFSFFKFCLNKLLAACSTQPLETLSKGIETLQKWAERFDDLDIAEKFPRERYLPIFARQEFEALLELPAFTARKKSAQAKAEMTKRSYDEGLVNEELALHKLRALAHALDHEAQKKMMLESKLEAAKDGIDRILSSSDEPRGKMEFPTNTKPIELRSLMVEDPDPIDNKSIDDLIELIRNM